MTTYVVSAWNESEIAAKASASRGMDKILGRGFGRTKRIRPACCGAGLPLPSYALLGLRPLRAT
jgi:hypothetical protein